MTKMVKKPNVLFVCGRNQWRSPTAATIYKNDPRIQVRAAGISDKSRIRLNQKQLDWADLVLVMENKHKSRILTTFRDSDLPRIENLDIPDVYPYMDDELIDLIKAGTEGLLAQIFFNDGQTNDN